MRYNYYGKSLACLAVMLGCSVSGFAQVYVGTNTPANTYSTLKEAVEKAASGKTIYLTQDVTETGSISFTGKTLTLNLKGFKLTLTGEGDDKANISVGAGATLKVQGGLSATWSVDTDNDYKVTYQSSKGLEQGTLQLDGTILAENGGQVTISSGNIVSSSTALCAVGDVTGANSVSSKIIVTNGYVKSQKSAVAAKGKGATLVVGLDSKKTADTGPVLEALDDAVIAGYESEDLGNTNVSLYNATLIARSKTAGSMACAVYHPQKGTLTIGGSSTNRLKIYSVDGCGVLMRGGTMTLNCGATITATGDKSLMGKVGDDCRKVIGVNGIVYDYDSDCYNSKNVSVKIFPKSGVAAPTITSTADAIRVVNANAADISGHIVLQCGTYSSDVSAYADAANDYCCEKEGDLYRVQKGYAQIGETKYAQVSAAFDAAKDGETIKLLQNATIKSSLLTVKNAVKLDLNGKHLTCHSMIVDGGHLTIQDGTAAAANSLRGTAAAPEDILTGLTGGILDGTGADDYTVLLKNGGTATLLSGTVVNTHTTKPQNNVVFRVEGDANQAADVKSTLNVEGGKIATIGTPVFVCYKGATVNVTGGELNGSGLAVIAGSGAAGYGGTTVNVSGGTLVAGVSSDGTASCGIYNPQDGVVNVSGGTITSCQGPGVLMRAGKLTMTGGTVEAQGDAAFAGTVGDAKSEITASGIVFDRDANYTDAANTKIKIQGDVKVTGAKSAIEVVNDNHATDVEDAVRVVSGTFSSDVSEFTDENAEVKESNGSYTVTSYMAQVGDIKYASLADALSGIASVGTVVLLDDIDITAAKTIIAEGKDITLDLNGNNIKAANCTEGNIEVDGKLTLRDSKENSTAQIYTEENYKYDVYDKPVIYICGNGEFVMESGKITTVMEDAGNYGQFGVGVFDKAKVTVKGGTIEAGWYAIAGNGSASQSDAYTTINIDGGTLISTADYAIYHPQNGKLTMSDGVVYGEAGGIAMRRGELLMTGGTVTSKGLGNTGVWGDGTGNLKNAAVIVPERVNGDVKAEIKGGKVTAEGDAVTIDAATTANYTIDFSITGGTFSSDVSKYCADNYTAAPNGDGTFGIVTGDVVVVSDDSYIVAEAGKDLAFSASTVNKLLVNGELAGVNVQLTKQFSTANWSSFYVPFAITLTEELLQNYDFAKIWDTEYVNDALTLEFKKLSVGDVIPANTPCLIKANAIGEGVLEFPSVTFKQPTKTYDCSTIEEKFTFYGTLENTTLMDKYGYFINPSTQQFTSVSKPTQYLRPLGFYLTIQNRETEAYIYPTEGEQQKVFGFRVIGDEETTGITEATQSANGVKEDRIYTLQGAFVGAHTENLPAGIYVVNGKKLVIK